MDFKNMTLGKKTGLGFGMVLVIFSCVLFYICLEINGVKKNANNMKDRIYPIVQMANAMNMAVVQTQQWLTDISATRATGGYDDGFDEAAAQAKIFNENLEKLKNSLPDSQAQLTELQRAYGDFYSVGKKMAQAYIDGGPEQGNKTMQEFDGQAEKMGNEIKSFVEEWNKRFDKNILEINESSESTFMASVFVGSIGIVIGVLLAFYLVISITGVLKRISEQLAQSSEEVASASNQVSDSSQNLAAGATEQASSLEETSSSLEEMASMTQRTAENAEEANKISQRCSEGAQLGNHAMEEMLTAMQEINASTDKISKIIKVIEEIAFQTNLLALNAAVEAARAGEAGKGFAVVAEEVRNLAQRSATAAKDTTALIEDSVKKAGAGNAIAEKTGKVLKEIVENVKKVAELIQEISAASREQAEGVQQVNAAVAQLDTVTQQNAANAEESASASEELAAQAENLGEVVEDLAHLVGLSTGGVSTKIKAARRKTLAPMRPTFSRTSGPKPARKNHHTQKGHAKEVKPHEVIPMDDFEDF
jgi:methyl-accepting chemotaxis protein